MKELRFYFWIPPISRCRFADAGNLMAQGELLRNWVEVCQPLGITPFSVTSRNETPAAILTSRSNCRTWHGQGTQSLPGNGGSLIVANGIQPWHRRASPVAVAGRKCRPFVAVGGRRQRRQDRRRWRPTLGTRHNPCCCAGGGRRTQETKRTSIEATPNAWKVTAKLSARCWRECQKPPAQKPKLGTPRVLAAADSSRHSLHSYATR